MGIVVAFVSQKGGVGKSTLARALARERQLVKLKKIQSFGTIPVA
jgi:cellulose biosynthesis protein BcsQ